MSEKLQGNQLLDGYMEKKQGNGSLQHVKMPKKI